MLWKIHMHNSLKCPNNINVCNLISENKTAIILCMTRRPNGGRCIGNVQREPNANLGSANCNTVRRFRIVLPPPCVEHSPGFLSAQRDGSGLPQRPGCLPGASLSGSPLPPRVPSWCGRTSAPHPLWTALPCPRTKGCRKRPPWSPAADNRQGWLHFIQRQGGDG